MVLIEKYKTIAANGSSPFGSFYKPLIPYSHLQVDVSCSLLSYIPFAILKYI